VKGTLRKISFESGEPIKMQQHASASSGLAKVRPKICWGRSKQVQEHFVRDNTWSLDYVHQSPDTGTVSFKVGNKLYALTASSESALVKDRNMTSETSLYKKYR